MGFMFFQVGYFTDSTRFKEGLFSGIASVSDKYDCLLISEGVGNAWFWQLHAPWLRFRPCRLVDSRYC